MYINAQDILPEDLLRKIQYYIEGEEIYIPKKTEGRLGWGERNGSRQQIDLRNHKIAQEFSLGMSIESLMETYHLSYDSIKRIIRKTKQAQSRPMNEKF